jgi:protein-S-isoprenylcysteine O-methyltransferase Ste14
MNTNLTITIFIVGTLGLAWVSRASLAAPRSHGFYRFFAWEAILALVLLNLNDWFKQPLSWHQLLSWLFLCISAYLVIDAVLRLRQMGKQDANRAEAPMLEFEKTTHLVTSGVYRYIRHPMYSSLLFLAWGVFFKQPGLVGVILAGAVSAFLVITARIEEVEDMRYFGEEYRGYMKKTWRFIPYVY